MLDTAESEQFDYVPDSQPLLLYLSPFPSPNFRIWAAFKFATILYQHRTKHNASDKVDYVRECCI